MKTLPPTITINRVFATRQDDERVLKALRLIVKASYVSILTQPEDRATVCSTPSRVQCDQCEVTK